MTEHFYKIFENVESKAKLIKDYWDNFYTEILNHIPNSYHSELQNLSTKLDESLSILIEELCNPTLTLATTGTTSSGKSTLVNFLCGAEILPMAVSEMSAGAVVVEYSEEKSLIIEKTDGALWETGEWKNISEEEIYDHLYKAMTSYIDHRPKNYNLMCPQAKIYYPFRLVKEGIINVPPTVKVKILDLPGLAFVGDSGNLSVIKQCREALCLVTYNSFETDQQKVSSLLSEVVAQVQDLGGSPARMLFILNRIDVFRTDREWPETENRFVEKTIQSIKNELTDQLREYSEEIKELKVGKLSTLPALLALQINNPNDQYSTKACKKVDQEFNGLIEEHILEDLPRKAENWSRQDRHRVREDLWKKSYAENFEANLQEHISKHFPLLVIPQAIDRFNVNAGNEVKEWAVQTTTAILNSSQERYEEECEKIEVIRQSLDRFLQLSDENLRTPFKEINHKIQEVIDKKSNQDPIIFLENKIEELIDSPPYDQLKDKLFPLYSWRREIGQVSNQILELIAKSLKEGKINLDNIHLKKANTHHIKLLEANLKSLINLGYCFVKAENGYFVEAKTDEEQKNLEQLNDELNKLSISLSLLMEDVLRRVSSQQIKRMYEAVGNLFQCHLSYMEEGANKLAPNIEITFPESQLKLVESDLDFRFSFQSGFAIQEGTWEEEKRMWNHWLWIFPKRETRSSKNATIPKVGDLLKDWSDQAKMLEPDIVKQIIKWLLEQIDLLKNNIDNLQKDVVNRYQARLDDAHQQVTIDYQEVQNIWQPIQQKAIDLAEKFKKLGIEQ